MYHGNGSESIYSGRKSKYTHITFAYNDISDEQRGELINKANAYMKLKPWKSKDKVSKYLGVSGYCLKVWESHGLIELPKDFKICGGRRAIKLLPLYKEIKHSWEKK